MNFRMSIREGQASRPIVISGRAIAPLAGKRSAGVIQKIPVIDRVRMFIEKDKKQRRFGNLREL
jgi:hypothetical protein